MRCKGFGAFHRDRRIALRLTLRAFCQKWELDPGNTSRMERGISAPCQLGEVEQRLGLDGWEYEIARDLILAYYVREAIEEAD